jgi:DNA-binding MarR family transcriptional regulator
MVVPRGFPSRAPPFVHPGNPYLENPLKSYSGQPTVTAGNPAGRSIAVARLTDRHLSGLLKARNGLAGFIQLSEREARAAGTTHAQHHVMLALHGHEGDPDPTVKDVAEALGVASPSAVELIARMVAAGLLARRTDPGDGRVTRLHLTRMGRKLMHQLSESHLPRLRDLHLRGFELLAE